MSLPPKGFQPTPFDYHEEIEVEIHSLTNLGHGVGRHGEDGWVVMVPFALPEERVKVRIFRNFANYSEGDLVEVIKPSPHREEPRCDLFGTCGGCQYQNFSYDQQLKWKRQQVAELLESRAGITHPVDEVIASPQLYGYRSKITPHFQKPKQGVMGPIGFLIQGRRQQIVDVPSCPIASDAINETYQGLRKEVTQQAGSYKKGATLLLRESSDGTVCTEGTEMCQEQVGDITFSFHAGEFFQNNPHILPAFVDYVISAARGEGTTAASDYLVDAYCGSGLFSLSGAAHFDRVSGVEVSESSIDWAKRNAAQNDIGNVDFIQGDASRIFEDIRFPASRTSVIIDPPRKGSNPDFLKQLVEFAPRRIVYVSCNPATQIRDLEELKEHYAITAIQPFDLFPHTRHLECVVVLERK